MVEYIGLHPDPIVEAFYKQVELLINTITDLVTNWTWQMELLRRGEEITLDEAAI